MGAGNLGSTGFPPGQYYSDMMKKQEAQQKVGEKIKKVKAAKQGIQ